MYLGLRVNQSAHIYVKSGKERNIDKVTYRITVRPYVMTFLPNTRRILCAQGFLDVFYFIAVRCTVHGIRYTTVWYLINVISDLTPQAVKLLTDNM